MTVHTAPRVDAATADHRILEALRIRYGLTSENDTRRMTKKELARAAKLSVSQVEASVKRLVAQGLIEEHYPSRREDKSWMWVIPAAMKNRNAPPIEETGE